MSVEKGFPDYWRFMNFTPEWRGAGGENTVFSAPTHAGYLTKVNNIYLRGYLTGALTKQDIEREVVMREERHATLSRSFGESHVLHEYVGVLNVTLTSAEVAEIAPQSSLSKSENFYDCPTLVVF